VSGAERTAWVAELQCFLCGSFAGTIECDRKPLPHHGIWRPVGEAKAQAVPDWRQLRCRRCGGALFAESVEMVQRRDPAEELRREVPRRGRPPRWLVEQRRREREEAESGLG
jgi:hypothetical protein